MQSKIHGAYASYNIGPANAEKIGSAVTTYSLHDTCLDKKFSVIFYVILDSTTSLPANNTPANVAAYITVTYPPFTQVISKLNETFSRICVSFEHCKTVVINNYSYNKWQSGAMDTLITNNYYSPQTINVYLPTEPGGGLGYDDGAYASPFPTTTVTTKDFIVIKPNSMLASNASNFSGSTLLHTFGHFFGLPHTFAEILSPTAILPDGPSAELADGSNSATHGDQFSDTDADCFPQQFVSPPTIPTPLCYYNYTVGVLDAGGKYYTPPLDNLMSFYNCRCRFTQEQYNFMARMILRRRLYLH